MFIPLLAALIPNLVGLAEKLIPGKDSGTAKKEFVQSILHGIYSKFLRGHIPDLPGVDEEAIFCEMMSFAIDYFVDHTFNKGNA